MSTHGDHPRAAGNIELNSHSPKVECCVGGGGVAWELLLEEEEEDAEMRQEVDVEGEGGGGFVRVDG